nr:probable prefoldin subunit 5 [Ipomoea batatas]
MLVPLTASLYVPGTLDDADKVLVDIGTGYYVEKSLMEVYTVPFFDDLTSNAVQIYDMFVKGDDWISNKDVLRKGLGQWGVTSQMKLLFITLHIISANLLRAQWCTSS